MFKFKKSLGSAASLLLVVGAIILVGIIIAYLVVNMSAKPAAPVVAKKATVPLPVYTQQLGNIKFLFESATNRGNTLSASAVTNPNQNSDQQDFTTTEKFIQVTVGAQDVGTVNTTQGAWDIGNIVDADGRNFVPDDSYSVGAWLPANSNCGALLKPAFNPIPCTKIYEVSNESDLSTLKIQVLTGANNNSASDFSDNNRISALIDLIVK